MHADVNGDGVISMTEMVSYLTSVFRVVYASEPQSVSHLRVSAEELAIATATQCFADADLNGDGFLTFEVSPSLLRCV